MLKLMIIAGLLLSAALAGLVIKDWEPQEKVKLLSFDDDKKPVLQSEREYIYVPLECMVDKWNYDVECYNKNVGDNNGKS